MFQMGTMVEFFELTLMGVVLLVKVFEVAVLVIFFKVPLTLYLEIQDTIALTSFDNTFFLRKRNVSRISSGFKYAKAGMCLIL